VHNIVREAEYARLRGKDRRFINGQKYALLSIATTSHWTAGGRWRAAGRQ
jgi:hypothetical protein